MWGKGPQLCVNVPKAQPYSCEFNRLTDQYYRNTVQVEWVEP
jgi:hypothetical protein